MGARAFDVLLGWMLARERERERGKRRFATVYFEFSHPWFLEVLCCVALWVSWIHGLLTATVGNT